MTINYTLVHFHVTFVHSILLLAAQRLHTSHIHGGLLWPYFTIPLNTEQWTHIIFYWCGNWAVGDVLWLRQLFISWFLSFNLFVCIQHCLNFVYWDFSTFRIGYHGCVLAGSKKKLSCNGMVTNWEDPFQCRKNVRCCKNTHTHTSNCGKLSKTSIFLFFPGKI